MSEKGRHHVSSQKGVVKAWAGRFGKRTAAEVEEFSSSVPFDLRLWPYDIRGSIAHVRMLARCGIIDAEEARAILRALREIADELACGAFPVRVEHEDIHMNIEVRLREKLGKVAGKLHTARSRNDQVALDMHLWALDAFQELMGAVRELQGVLLDRAEAEGMRAVMPGYTHLQQAQPVLLAHHLLAHFWAFQRDVARLAEFRQRASMNPLGACALAGTSLPVDPEYTRRVLGLESCYANSIDAVSDRDFVCELLFACAMIMTHLSRLAEEIIIWSSYEWGFVELDDAYATGSSTMPQKKNPDVAELARAKCGRAYGNLVRLLTVLKGLPLAYNRDLQEDKEATFDSVDHTLGSLRVMSGLMRTVRFCTDRMARATQEHICATELVDYLVRKGAPFRDAHAAVARMVRRCLDEGRSWREWSEEDLKRAHPLLDLAALERLDPERTVASKRSPGGTAPERVRESLLQARRILMEWGKV